jgi:hypothetical protein
VSGSQSRDLHVLHALVLERSLTLPLECTDSMVVRPECVLHAFYSNGAGRQYVLPSLASGAQLPEAWVASSHQRPSEKKMRPGSSPCTAVSAQTGSPSASSTTGSEHPVT